MLSLVYRSLVCTDRQIRLFLSLHPLAAGERTNPASLMLALSMHPISDLLFVLCNRSSQKIGIQFRIGHSHLRFIRLTVKQGCGRGLVDDTSRGI